MATSKNIHFRVLSIYFHILSVFLRWSFPVSRIATWVHNPPWALSMRGVTTQVSALKSINVYITSFKNAPDT